MKCAENVEKSFFCSAPTLATLNVSYGTGTAAMWIVPQLKSLCDYCGFKETLTDRQMAELAKVIAINYYYLKTTEIMLFFAWIKAGRYGKFYGRIEPVMIMTALIQFVKERNERVDRHNQEEQTLKREQELRDNPPISYEEYLRITGKDRNPMIEELMI